MSFRPNLKESQRGRVIFDSYQKAGKLLAEEIKRRKLEFDFIVGINRRGLAVASECARQLKLPLDIKIVYPLSLRHKKGSYGVITENLTKIEDEQKIQELKLNDKQKQDAEKHAKTEIENEIAVFASKRQQFKVEGKKILLISHLTQNGFADLASICDLRSLGAKKIVFAVPVISQFAKAMISPKADKIIALHEEERLDSPESFYSHYTQPTDTEAIKILEMNKEILPE